MSRLDNSVSRLPRSRPVHMQIRKSYDFGMVRLAHVGTFLCNSVKLYGC